MPPIITIKICEAIKFAYILIDCSSGQCIFLQILERVVISNKFVNSKKRLKMRQNIPFIHKKTLFFLRRGDSHQPLPVPSSSSSCLYTVLVSPKLDRNYDCVTQ